MSKPLYEQTKAECALGSTRPLHRMSADERRALLDSLTDEQLAKFIHGAHSQGWRWHELNREKARRMKQK